MSTYSPPPLTFKGDEPTGVAQRAQAVLQYDHRTERLAVLAWLATRLQSWTTILVHPRLGDVVPEIVTAAMTSAGRDPLGVSRMRLAGAAEPSNLVPPAPPQCRIYARPTEAALTRVYRRMPAPDYGPGVAVAVTVPSHNDVPIAVTCTRGVSPADRATVSRVLLLDEARSPLLETAPEVVRSWIDEAAITAIVTDDVRRTAMTSHKLTSTSRLPYDDMCGCDREDEPRIAAAPYFDGALEGAIAALERQFDLRRQGLPSSIDEPIARAEDVLGEVPISRRMDGTSRPRSAMDSLVASFATIAADWRR